MKTVEEIKERINDIKFYIKFANDNFLDMGDWMTKMKEELLILNWVIEDSEDVEKDKL